MSKSPMLNLNTSPFFTSLAVVREPCNKIFPAPGVALLVMITPETPPQSELHTGSQRIRAGQAGPGRAVDLEKLNTVKQTHLKQILY